MAAMGRGCVKTQFSTNFGGRLTLPRVLIVDPGASNSLGIFSGPPFLEFLHGLGRLQAFANGSNRARSRGSLLQTRRCDRNARPFRTSGNSTLRGNPIR
jgi:hypothetical protein